MKNNKMFYNEMDRKIGRDMRRVLVFIEELFEIKKAKNSTQYQQNVTRFGKQLRKIKAVVESMEYYNNMRNSIFNEPVINNLKVK